MAAILLVSIAEALVRMDTCKQNKCHTPFLGSYSITSKSTCACSATLHLGCTVTYKYNVIIYTTQTHVHTHITVNASTNTYVPVISNRYWLGNLGSSGILVSLFPAKGTVPRGFDS